MHIFLNPYQYQTQILTDLVSNLCQSKHVTHPMLYNIVHVPTDGHSVSGGGSQRQAPDGVGGAVQQVRAAAHAAGAQRWTRAAAQQAALSRRQEAARYVTARCTRAYC